MGTRKRTSELIFNLQWRNKPDSGGDKSNVIGMYDTPTTTSNFEMFKSYLLKNSGVAGNDVKVTYLTDDRQEWILDSQEWFEIALSAFRLKARLGEVIYLKLDKISSAKRQMTRKHSNDVETQFDVGSIGNDAIAPPEWFLSYMKQFKHEIVDEVTVAVSTNFIPNIKEKESVSQITTTLNSKKVKAESSKRCRKNLVLGENPLDKDFLRTLKSERKLENKLDKLDAKTKKIKDKKQALIKGLERFENELRGIRKFRHDENKIEERPRVEIKASSSSVLTSTQQNDDATAKDSAVLVDTEDDVLAMNATLVNSSNSGIYEHMMGGEVYLHTWVVVNNGKLPWSSNTELRLTWGSAELVPSVYSLKCPSLQPGEKGTISVRFEVPKKPGTYESYWNFYDKNIRFGNSLNCCIVVEEPLASIIPEEVEFTDRSKPSSKLMANPKETNECSKSFVPKVSEEAEVKDNNIITKEIIIFPKGVGDDKKPIKVPICSDVEKIMYCSNSDGEYKWFEIPISKTVERDSKNKERESTDNSNYFGCKAGSSRKLMNFKEQPILPLHPSNIPLSEETNTQVENVPTLNSNLLMHEETIKTTLANVPDRIFADLSRGMENMHIAGSSHVDSDSDWESINELRVPNKYGINEKDLIVDLSHLSEDKCINREENCENNDDKEEINVNQDNNNNNDKEIENNNSLRGSVSEVSEASSDLSAGYDVLNMPTCAEKEDESSGYVYITVDGNKLPVPKYILRPDFLANAEEAPPPSMTTDDENAADSTKNLPELIPTTNSPDKQVSLISDSNIPEVSHCSAAGSSFSDVTSGRLFIFPQSHPGYEVVNSTSNNSDQINTASMSNSNDPHLIYTWAVSPNQYSLGDLQSACAINPLHLKTDLYGPLEQPLPTSQPNQFSSEQEHPGQAPHQFEASRFSQTSSTTSHGFHHPHFVAQQQPPVVHEFHHVPNFQQSSKKPQPPVFKQEIPTAPPQQPKSPEQPPPGAVPVHILPENLVTGAVNVASSAINTARSVINMIVPPKQEPGRWVNGHWVTDKEESLRAKNLIILAEMGFWDADLNATLLARYNDDIARVVSELIE